MRRTGKSNLVACFLIVCMILSACSGKEESTDPSVSLSVSPESASVSNAENETIPADSASESSVIETSSASSSATTTVTSSESETSVSDATKTSETSQSEKTTSSNSTTTTTTGSTSQAKTTQLDSQEETPRDSTTTTEPARETPVSSGTPQTNEINQQDTTPSSSAEDTTTPEPTETTPEPTTPAPTTPEPTTPAPVEKYKVYTPNTPCDGTVSGLGTYEVGATVTLTFTPDANYKLSYARVNGGEKITSSTYTFTMPDYDVTAKAIFEYVEPEYKYATLKVHCSATGWDVNGEFVHAELDFYYTVEHKDGMPYGTCTDNWTTKNPTMDEVEAKFLEVYPDGSYNGHATNGHQIVDRFN